MNEATKLMFENIINMIRHKQLKNLTLNSYTYTKQTMKKSSQSGAIYRKSDHKCIWIR